MSTKSVVQRSNTETFDLSSGMNFNIGRIDQGGGSSRKRTSGSFTGSILGMTMGTTKKKSKFTFNSKFIQF